MEGKCGAGGWGMSAECLSRCFPLRPSAPVASTPLPVLSGFPFSHSQTVTCGGCSHPHLMWEGVTQGQRVPNYRVLNIDGALHMRAS